MRVKGVAKICFVSLCCSQLFAASFWARGVSEKSGWQPSLFQGYEQNYCWAYTASALIDHWQQNAQTLSVAGIPTGRQNIVDYLIDKFPQNQGAQVSLGLNNFFITYYQNIDYTGKVHTKKYTDYKGSHLAFSSEMQAILQTGSPIGISYLTTGAAHAITIWGAEFDESGEMTTMYATDSASTTGELGIYTKNGDEIQREVRNDAEGTSYSELVKTQKIPANVYIVDYLALYTGEDMHTKTETDGGGTGSGGSSGGSDGGGDGSGGGNQGGADSGNSGGSSSSGGANPKSDLNSYGVSAEQLPLLEVLLAHNPNAANLDNATLKQSLNALNSSFNQLSKANHIAKTLPLLHKQDINARVQSVRFGAARLAVGEVKRKIRANSAAPKGNLRKNGANSRKNLSLNEEKNPNLRKFLGGELSEAALNLSFDENFSENFAANTQNGEPFYELYAANALVKSDIAPNLHFDEDANRLWANAGGGYFKGADGAFSFQNISVGYDKRAFGGDLVLGTLLGFTNSNFSSSGALSGSKLSQEPKIYTLRLYSNALLGFLELQNELSASAIDGELNLDGASGDYKGFGGYFDALLKADFDFALRPQILARVSFESINAFESPIYTQKAHKDTALSVGAGAEYVYYKQSGFYRASFLASKDFYHSDDEYQISLANAQKFIAYKKSNSGISYEIELGGYESFANGVFLSYGVSGYFNADFKGIKANLQAGWRF